MGFSWTAKGILAALLAVAGAAGLSSCGNRGSAGEAVKIGAALPLSGDSAAWGQQGRWGAEIAVAEANGSGGIGGKRLEIVFEDTQAIPRVAKGAISKLISVDHVPAVVGDIVSATSLAMSPTAEENRVVLMVPTASAPALTDAGRFIYRVWPSDDVEGTFLANWAASRKLGRVCILHISTDYGLGLAQIFTKRFQALGGTVASVQSYAQDETDFRPYLARVKTQAPDVVYIISYYKDAALLLRQAREIGIKAQFLGATAVESKELIKLAGNAAEGLIYPTIVDFDPSNPNPRQKAFIDSFRAAYKNDPDWAASHTHDAVLVIAEAMKSGARSGDEIRQEIDRRHSFEGVTGSIVFDQNGDVVGKSVVMKIVRNGAFEMLGDDGKGKGAK